MCVNQQGGQRGEKLFDYSVQKASKFAAYLDSAVRETGQEQNENNQSLDVSEQISRLWQLKQEGA